MRYYILRRLFQVANQDEVRVIQESRTERLYFKSAVTAGFGTLAFVAVKLGMCVQLMLHQLISVIT